MNQFLSIRCIIRIPFPPLPPLVSVRSIKLDTRGTTNMSDPADDLLASMVKTQASIDAQPMSAPRVALKKKTAYITPTPAPPPPPAAPPCGICGCTDFKPHQFKPKKCVECSHEHGSSQRDAAKNALMKLGEVRWNKSFYNSNLLWQRFAVSVSVSVSVSTPVSVQPCRCC